MRIATVKGDLQRVVTAAARGDDRTDPVIPRNGPVKILWQNPPCRILVLWQEMGAIGNLFLVILLNQMTADVAHVRDIHDCAETEFPLDP